MASIVKVPSGKWRARLRPEPGASEVCRHFDTKAQAEAWVTTVKADALRGTILDQSGRRTTVRAYAEAWRAAQPHRPRTASSVKGVLDRYVYPTLGDRPVASLRKSEVQAAVGKWSLTLAPSTVALVHATLSSVLRAAVSDRLRADNPAEGVALPRPVKAPVQPLSHAQVTALLDGLDDSMLAPVLLAVGCGLRAGEVFGLRMMDVDLLRGLVHVRQQRGTDEVVGPPKTPASHRTVPLPSTVRDALSLAMSGKAAGSDVLLFTVRRNTAHVRFRRAADAADLRHVRFHDLRHTYASALIHAGESVKVVQARLGHASARETLDTYAHLWPDSEASTRSAVDAFLTGTPEPVEDTSTG
jgi:integrase